jgi:hypothetical protein
VIPNVSIIFKLDGQRQRLDFRRLPFSVWGELKRELGFTPRSLLDALDNVDVEAIGALIWLERRQHNRRLPWAEVRRELETAGAELEFEPLDVLAEGKSLFGSDEEEAEEDAETDPTTAGDSSS